MSATTDDLVQEASILCSWGFPTFPLARKKPRCGWKHFQRRRPSDHELARLFRLSDVDGIAIVPGPFSGGFAVRDYDKPHAYQRWAETHPDLARVAPTVRTHRGYHVWLRSTVPAYRALDDGEFIGNGRHYCVAPPTRHPKGGAYQWLHGPPLGPSEFPLLNPFEVGLLAAPTRSRKGVGVAIRHSSASCVFSDPTTPLPVAIRECVLKTLPTAQGQRNHLLHRFARALRDHVPHDAPAGVLYAAVLDWWQRALPVIGTKEFAITLNDFRRAWSVVLVPMSMSRPLAALRGGATGTNTRARLLGACRALALETGGAFFLSRRTAGQAVAVSGARAGVLLKEMVTLGELVVVRKGRPSRTGRTGTTVYQLSERRPRTPHSEPANPCDDTDTRAP